MISTSHWNSRDTACVCVANSNRRPRGEQWRHAPLPQVQPQPRGHVVLPAAAGPAVALGDAAQPLAEVDTTPAQRRSASAARQPPAAHDSRQSPASRVKVKVQAAAAHPPKPPSPLLPTPSSGHEEGTLTNDSSSSHTDGNVDKPSRQPSPSAQPLPKSSSSPSSDEVHRRYLVVLACHVQLADALAMDDHRAVTLKVHSAIAAKLQGSRGLLAEQLADGCTVYFNWPKVTEHAEECACGLALALVAAMARLNEELRQQGMAAAGVDAVAVRMGIHGALSVISHMVMTGGESMPVAQGEAPTVARRLQDLARPGTVVVTREIFLAASTRFQLEPLRVEGGLRVQGAALETYVLTQSGSKQSLALDDGQRTTSLVGRSAEISRLLSLVSLAQQSAAGQAVVLTGAAGTGKSALVRDVIAKVHGGDTPTCVLLAQSSATMKDLVPLHTAKQWLARWHGADMPTAAVAGPRAAQSAMS